MPAKNLSTIKRIELLVSFLDEENAEILKNVESELLLLTEDENAVLKEIFNNTEDSFIAQKLKEIITHNNFRFSESVLLFWIKNPERQLFDLLVMISEIEYPELDEKSLKEHFDKMLKDVWTAITHETSALEVVKLLKNVIFNSHKFVVVPFDKTTIKHLMINDVLSRKETNNLFLNIIYLSLIRELDIPIVPLKIGGLIILGFKNMPPYNISFLDNEFLFFIDNSSFEPYPEEELRNNLKINTDTEMSYTPFTDAEMALLLLKWLSALYEKNNKTMMSEKIKEIIALLEV